MPDCANLHWTARELANQKSEDKLNLDIPFQRGLKWDDYAKSFLITSMILGYRIGEITFSHLTNCPEKYRVVDGKQRIDAITSFISGEYILSSGLKPIERDGWEAEDISGFDYSGLPEWMRNKISEYLLTIYYYDNLTEEQEADLIDRMNHNIQFTRIELNRIKSKSLKRFQELASSNAIMQAFSGKDREKYYDEIAVMQAWYLCFTDNRSLLGKQFDPVVRDAIVTEEEMGILTQCLDMVNGMYNKLNSDDKDEAVILKNMKKRTHLVSLIYMCKTALERGLDRNAIIDAGIAFFTTSSKSTTVSNTYDNAAGRGSAQAHKVRTRLDEISKSIG